MSSLLSALLSIAALTGEEVKAVNRDLAAQPPSERLYVRYLDLSSVPDNRFDETEAALKFVVPSTSKSTNLDRQIPWRVPGTKAYRINLNDLDWRWQDFVKVVQRNEYSDNPNPLIVNGQWFIYELADTTESDAYYLLLYQGKPPKTRDEFLKFWGIDKAKQDDLGIGWIETRSQVSKTGTRFIQGFAGVRGRVWLTQDVLKIERKSDPLEFPDGVFRHDGEESIALSPKISIRHKTRGVAQMYLLSNGQGNRVEEAPSDLVEDSLRTIRKQTAIITPGSCISCHQKGLNMPSVNGIEALLLQGVQLTSKDRDNADFVERFHLGTKGLIKELDRSNEDFATFVFACNGMTAEANAANYRDVLRDYEADLTLERAAYELGSTDVELRNALAYATAAKIDLGPRFSVLAHGDQIPRTVYAEGYLKAYELLKLWRQR